MSRDPQKRRIPTSEELESTGAILPAAGQSPGKRRGFLSRFHRAKRFRVSADVAARKYVGIPQAAVHHRTIGTAAGIGATRVDRPAFRNG